MADYSKYGYVPEATTTPPVDDTSKYAKYGAVPDVPAPQKGVVQETVQDLARPVLKAASSVRSIATDVGQLPRAVSNIAREAFGKPTTPLATAPKEYDYGYFGKAQPIGGDGKFNAKNVKDAVGVGAELSSYIPLGGAVKTVGTSILKRTLPGAGKLVKEGFIGGGLYGFGKALQDDKGIVDTAIDTVTNAGIGAVAAPLVGLPVGALGNVVARGADKLFRPFETHTQDVGRYIDQALSVQGKKSIGMALNAPKKRYEAFNVLHDLAPNLKVTDEFGDSVAYEPINTNFQQFGEALKGGKDKLWEGIDGAIKDATGKGLHVDAVPIIEDLNRTASNPFTTSEVRTAAVKLSDEIALMTNKEGQIPIAGLTEYNKVLNTKIGGVLTGTTDNAVRDLEAKLAKKLSEAADTSIEGISDGRFQALKDKYSALRSIEKDAVRRMQQEARMLDNSLGDFVGKYGTIEIVNGIIQATQGNVAPLVKGVGIKALGVWQKSMRQPSSYLRKAFKEIDNFKKKGQGPNSTSDTSSQMRDVVPNNQPKNDGSINNPTNNVTNNPPMTASTIIPQTLQQEANTVKGITEQAKKKVSEEGSRSAMGGMAGLEIDEQGNMTYNAEKGAMGALGMAAIGKNGDKWIRDAAGKFSKDEIVASVKGLVTKALPKEEMKEIASQLDVLDSLKGMSPINREISLERVANYLKGKKLFDFEGKIVDGDIPIMEAVLNETAKVSDELAGIPSKAQEILERKGNKVVLPTYKGETDLTTKLLKDLEGKSTVSKQYILDATNRGELKQVERDLFRKLLDGEGNVVDVSKFANKVKAELLPLKVNKARDMYSTARGGTGGRYENIALPDDLRGSVKNYEERIYESPIKTSAGEVHFGQPKDKVEGYFGHTRIEDMSDNQTRRVIEVQSDLYQKGNLDREAMGSKEVAARKIDGDNLSFEKREKEVAKLQQYNDPTAHFRMIREEIKKAADDGKTKLQFPTGETAMKIEGLGSRERWTNADNMQLTPERLKVGESVYESAGRPQDAWIITDVLGDGKFKAVPKQRIDQLKYGKASEEDTKRILDNATESFDISGKVDQNNPIYKFYNKEVRNYLNKFGGKEVVDDKGVKWIEIPIDKSRKGAIEAFGILSPVIFGASTLGSDKASEK